MSMTIRFPRFVYRALLVDLGILLMDSLIVLWLSVAGQAVDWWLPASMVFLLVALLVMAMVQVFN